MASASEIRTRINSVSETKKVTDAMYMISSVKMRKAKRGLEDTKPYFDALRQEIADILRYMPENRNRYFRICDEDGIKGRALLLITSDKGLSGSYNHDATKRAEDYLSRHPDTILFPVGEYGHQYFLSQHGPLAENFFYAAGFPTISAAQNICEELLDYYLSDRVDRIDIIYTDFGGGFANENKSACLLPLDHSEFYGSGDAPSAEKVFYPDADTVLGGIIPSYLAGFIYSALVESYSSEQQARMNAMKTAGDNAEEMLKKLRLSYNSIRQAAVTREITEISSGAKALRRKHTK